MEEQKCVADQSTEQYEAQVARLEARNSALDVLLKTKIEQKADVTPLTKKALFLKNNIYQMQV